eukprot:CAMPEP_0201532824 /NCGR_PEP_ID=MMETSP0161_2-20130828/51416_1 /ASSEMBLY_ACC=CAM_ASM_000251 /TAXON_ID=180227 /ORGANISM="Neoparamoeba aestuarina, Strain SoJaBio B1-5/56/2" /LENGTH=202 /DNA_ID=CAMNT_0047936455 /DNA_START=84 /DNA_END=692 /DNA_ORIENTATION=+
MTARQCGWHVIVPDFTPSYRYGSRRGRSERVKIIYQHLLCLETKPDVVVFAGHSQGGAASSLASESNVVQSCNITGLFLMGSESPLSLDGMGWVPVVPHIQILHAKNDKVIPVHDMQRVAERWECEFIEMNSVTQSFAQSWEGDDICHDFLAKDLVLPLLEYFEDFLANCHRDPKSAKDLSEGRKRKRKNSRKNKAKGKEKE